MAKAAGHILKGDDVKLKGRFRLQSSPGPQRVEDTSSPAPQVHIVQSQPEFAVIEVTCSCGTKTSLRCEYAKAQGVSKTEDAPGAKDISEAESASDKS